MLALLKGEGMGREGGVGWKATFSSSLAASLTFLIIFLFLGYVEIFFFFKFFLSQTDFLWLLDFMPYRKVFPTARL